MVAARVAGIMIGGTLALSAVTFSNNASADEGGAIYNGRDYDLTGSETTASSPGMWTR